MLNGGYTSLKYAGVNDGFVSDTIYVLRLCCNPINNFVAMFIIFMFGSVGSHLLMHCKDVCLMFHSQNCTLCICESGFLDHFLGSAFLLICGIKSQRSLVSSELFLILSPVNFIQL